MRRDQPCIAPWTARHGWSRLKWLADFAALLASRPCAERAQICAQARWWQPGIALDLALSLAHRLLGLEVEDSRPLSVLTPLALTVIEETAAGREPGDNPRARRAIRALQWRLMPGVRYAALESLRRLRGSEDRLAVALPGGLHWLYWPLRLPLGLMRIVRRRLARAVPQSPE